MTKEKDGISSRQKWTHEKLAYKNPMASDVLMSIPDMSTDWEKNSLTAALQRRTLGFLWMKSWTRRRVVASPSIEGFKASVDGVLSNLV